MKENIIITKSFQFAIKIVKQYKMLCEIKREYVLSKQMLRSGTSIGANVREAHNAESKMDFIHKMAIAQKEASEVIYWIELLYETGYLPKKYPIPFQMMLPN
jgi:four helix bundle protein